jgi:hydroxyacylglutathione hydrolase
MIFHQVLYRDLGCASYFLADGGQAVVVDPRWDIDVYLELAAQEGVKIAYVLDTHTHADHVSGRERLAAETGAIAYGPLGSAPSQSAGPVLSAGEEIVIGAVRLRAFATPGHRPEHISLVVSDVSRGGDPWMVLSGDSLLVGDLARPDLAVEPSDGARELYRSTRALLELGDHVEVWPAHVGGSLCGGAGLSGKPSSTIGYERAHNPLLRGGEGEFVRELLRGLQPRPPHVERIVKLNHLRAASFPPQTPVLDDERLLGEIAAGARVIDVRPPREFDEGHLRGAINLPPGRSQGTRAGWVLDPGDRLIVTAADIEEARKRAAGLHAVGLWGIVGVAAAAPELWLDCGLEVLHTSSWDIPTLAERIGAGASLIDVREPGEWRSGHVSGSHSLPLHRLADAGPLDNGDHLAPGPLAVVCAGGLRAAFAASVIRRSVGREVIRVAGGGVGDLPRHGIALTVGD